MFVGKVMRILIVDDNEANRILAQSVLEREGYIAVTASSGEKALAECRGVKFDLILLDILMPRMNGIQTLRKLRQTDERNAQTPVFALTAYSSASEVRMFKQAGFEFIISKPLRQKDVELAWNAYKNQDAQVIPINEPINKKDNLKHALIDQPHWKDIKQNASSEDLISTAAIFWNNADIQIAELNENKDQASRANIESLSKLRKGAHTLKGSAAMLALKRLEVISDKLQNAIPEHILTLVDDVEKCAEESRLAHLSELKTLEIKRIVKRNS